MAVGAQQPVEAVHKGADGALRQAAPVAAAAHRAQQAAAGAVLADFALPQKHAVGAEQPEIVQRLHRRHALGKAGPEHRRAGHQQGVVHMHQLDLVFADQRPHLPVCLTAEHRPQRQQQFLPKAAVRLGVGTLVHEHLVAAGLQQRPLGGKDGVLAAGQPVMGVHQQNAPGRFLLCLDHAAHLPFLAKNLDVLLYPFIKEKKSPAAGAKPGAGRRPAERAGRRRPGWGPCRGTAPPPDRHFLDFVESAQI